MSKEAGLAAFALEAPSKIPRTEYSAAAHWALIEAVTGLFVDQNSPPEERQAASSAFVKAWDYGFVHNTPLDEFIFGNKRTSMGHAEYAQGGGDYNDRRFSLFEEPSQVFAWDFNGEFGPRGAEAERLWFNRNYAVQTERYPDAVNTTGVYVTCVSGLIELCGWDMLLLAAGEDPNAFGEFAGRYARWLRPSFEGLAACDAPLVSVHDDIVWTTGPFIHPDWYRRFVFPMYEELFTPLREAGKKILFICDGCYDAFADDVAACGVNGFVMEPLTDLAAMAERYGKTHVLVGNADTRILLRGQRQDIHDEVKRCMDIGRGCPGFIMAVGNHIPPNTPVENALYYNDCYETLCRR